MYKKKKKNVKKFRKTFNTRLIKAHQTYSREEIAELFHVHSNTVGSWFKEGLPKIDNQQPHLIFGQDLIDFLKARAIGRKHPCSPDELYCCKCQRSRKSQSNTVYIKVTRARTNVVGFCETCGTKINKAISPQKIDFFQQTFIVQTIHREHLIECSNTCAIIDKKREVKHG